MLLSVLIPAYNEEQTIRQVLDNVQELPIEKQIIVVDDGSTDRTYAILEEIQEDRDITLVHYNENRGKGFAIRSGIPHIKGDSVVIQDADMELCPKDILHLVELLREEETEVVYGSRFYEGERERKSTQLSC